MSRVAAIAELADKALDRLTGWVGHVTSFAFPAIVAITTFEVVMRYFLRSPTIWVHEFSVLLAAIAFVVGGPLVHQRRRHITISYFYERMGRRLRRWVDLFSSALILAFLCLLAYATIQQASLSVATRETSGTALNLPIPAILKVLFAACVVLMVAQTVLHLVADARQFHRGRDEH
jgi:TRAP-type C4-dicarboxylate transport system permease small subunit